MRLNGVSFPEAVRVTAELAGIVTASGQTASPPPRSATAPTVIKPGKTTCPPPEGPSGLPPADALTLVTEAAARLWTPEGIAAREYLHGRGLSDETIRAARLGWTPRAEGVSWKPPGVVIPWLAGDRLALVKIRSSEDWRMRFPKERRPPRYIEAYRDQPRIFPGLEAIEPGRPLVIVEGELDALLLDQELHDLAAVATLGSASNRPNPDILVDLMPAAPWFLSGDTKTDPPGDTKTDPFLHT
jgi:hypothetical protein